MAYSGTAGTMGPGAYPVAVGSQGIAPAGSVTMNLRECMAAGAMCAHRQINGIEGYDGYNKTRSSRVQHARIRR